MAVNWRRDALLKLMAATPHQELIAPQDVSPGFPNPGLCLDGFGLTHVESPESHTLEKRLYFRILLIIKIKN